MKSRAVLEVNLNLLKKNYRALKALTKDSFFCPMLKANAYGHGAGAVAQALQSSGVQQVGVMSLDEAGSLRKQLKSMDILIFNPVLNKEDLSWILEEKMALVCSHWEALKKVSELKKPARIHLKFDTGFSRLGFSLDSAEALHQFLKDHPQIKLEGLASQLVFGEELGDDKSFSSLQLKNFSRLKNIFPALPFHAFNTSALLSSFVHQKKESFGVRPGIGLYGSKTQVSFQNEEAKRNWEKISLSPVSQLKSQVLDFHKIPKGASVSYGGLWKAKRPSQIATVSLGYGDGFFRSAGSFREVLFRGKKRPIVGTVCMDFFMIDVTACDKEEEAPLQMGEEVVIFGEQKGAFLSPEVQAKASGTIVYELFSRLSDRVHRVYKES